MIVVRDLFTRYRGLQPGLEGGLRVHVRGGSDTHTQTHTHTHTPNTVHTLTYYAQEYLQAPAQQFKGGRRPPTPSQTAHRPRTRTPVFRQNTTPQTDAKTHTHRPCKARKIQVRIPSLPQSGGASQASVSYSPSLSRFLFFFSLFTASESSRPINLEGPTERRAHLYASLGLANT